MNASVVVYSSPECAACRMTVRMLNQLGVEHVVVDVVAQPQAAQVLRDLGYTSAPVVTNGSSWWSGFRPDLLRSLSPSTDTA